MGLPNKDEVKGGFMLMFNWGDVVVAVLTLGIYVHVRRVNVILVNIWGKQLLTVPQIEAFDLLRQAQAKLKQKGW